MRIKILQVFNSNMDGNIQRIYIDEDSVPETPFTLNLIISYKHVDKEFILQNPEFDSV